MAQITPTQKQTYFSDFLLDFKKNPHTNDLVRVTNEQSVINSIKKILKTNNFEIPYNPYFGANISKYLFEPLVPTTEMELKNEITFAIANFEPRADVIDVTVNGQPDNNSIDITITVAIINNPNPVTITTTLYRVR